MINNICRGDGECLKQVDDDYYIKNPNIKYKYSCISIKYKNYILCNEKIPEMYIGCRNCHMLFENCS